ncbi:MAG: hypothetical protein MK538_19545 [Planctomycetes bacterium]|nr:hypothetical protein [Planctomycetota bacterium]
MIRGTLLLFLLGIFVGCGGSSDDGLAAVLSPTPAHPAMKEAPSERPRPAASMSRGLPSGHPPVGGGAERTSPSGGGAPSGAPGGGMTSTPVSAAELEEQLASRGGLKVKFPAGWVLEGGSGMRLGTARLPRVDGDSEDGEMSIIPAFGSVDANVARWEGQFEGRPKSQLSQRTADGVEITIVEIDGTFSAGGGPMMRGGGTKKPGTKLLAAIVQVTGEQRTTFFKAWGPAATMEKWRGDFQQFAESIRLAR